MKKIMIFNDFQLPIPAVRGGAVQQLTTTLIEQNEKNPMYEFIVFSPYNKEAKKLATGYKHSRIYYSNFANIIRLYTNIVHKLKLPINLSAVPIPPSIAFRLKTLKIDAVYVNGYIRGFLTIKKFTPDMCPVYYHHHVVTDILNEKSIQGDKIFSNCSKIGFVSEYASEKAKTGIENYDRKIKIFRNCIDVNKFHVENKEKNRNNIRAKYNIASTEVLLVYVGRFVENKGVLQLLKAFKVAHESNSNIKLMLIGGETYSSNKKTTYVQCCWEVIESIKDSVNMPGYIHNDELPQFLNSADIGIVPSVYEEACGLTALEMMASGLPIITTDAGGLKEYVAEECKEVSTWRNGMNPDDIINGLVISINKLVDDKDKRSEYGKFAENHVKKYDSNGYLHSFEKFID